MWSVFLVLLLTVHVGEQAGVLHLREVPLLLVTLCWVHNVIGCANTLTSLPCSAPVLHGAPDVIEAAVPTHPQCLG